MVKENQEDPTNNTPDVLGTSARIAEARKNPESHVIESGYISVGDGHRLFFERWGNRQATPIYHNHGGPGANVNDSHKALYDPTKHHVIFPRQRGTGESTPAGGLENNTTKSLVRDINIVRAELGITGKMFMSGGSWGSTLNLAYAETHPKNVEAMTLWSIYLARPRDNDYLMLDRSHDSEFPYQAARARFLSSVPPHLRGSYRDVSSFFHERMLAGDAEAAVEYHLNTYLVCNLPGTTAEELETGLRHESDIIPAGLLETHFIKNAEHPDFDPKILEKIATIRHIPTTAVAGRFDYCTPLYQALDLKAAWPELNLIVVPSGHIRYDERGMKQAIQEGVKDFV